MYKIKHYHIVWLLILGFYTSSAQTEDELKKQYQDAKYFFRVGKYNLAQEAFKPLIQSNVKSSFSSYASYYYALSAYRQGYVPMAKSMFLQIKQHYPNWSKIDEVNFWLASLHFENEDYNSGLNVIGDIRNKELKKSSAELAVYHISKIEKLETLADLQANNPDNKIVAKVLAQHLAAQPLAKKDHEQLAELIEKFDLDKNELNVEKVEKTVFKDKYKVAVLMPFIINQLEAVDRPKVNQFVLDTYEGMRLALDSLKKAGFEIELYSYDTKRDSATTAGILQRDELKGMDVIVGPLFPKPISLVNDFAYKNRVNIINPLSTNSEYIGNNPYSFLLKPCNETIGRLTADYVAEHVKNKAGIIFYGTSKGDSTIAFSYKQRLEEEDFKIVVNKKIGKGDSRSILDLLLISDRKIKEASSAEARDRLSISMDSIGHIFVASNDELISTKVISALETRGDSIVVVGSVDWMNLPAINYEVYSRLGAVLYAPLYKNRESIAYTRFRDNYIEKHKKAPTTLVEDGYELMFLIGNSLKEHGKYFQLAWNEEGYQEGYLSLGYDYMDSNDNQVLPILTFGEENLEIVYETERKRNADRKK